jgi:outer membrane protein OmpA-like peptidoglycan-associated protein
MPPWFAEPGITRYANEHEKVLSETALDTLARWADGGAPAGDPATAPPARVFPSGWNITPDVVVEMPKPFELPARGTIITLSGAVLFKTNESELLPIAEQQLRKVADALNAYDEGRKIVVAGHTDSRGSASFNKRLSLSRAESVRTFLVNSGVSPDRIRAVGKDGPTKLPNSDIEGGHKSTMLCHLGNIAYRTKKSLNCDPKDGKIKDDAEAMKHWRREYDAKFDPFKQPGAA